MYVRVYFSPACSSLQFSCVYCSGVSSFNQFIHELSVDSDLGSSVDNLSGEDYSDDDATPLTPRSESSQASSASGFSKHDMCQGKLALCFRYILAWILFPAKFLAGILTYFYIANTTLGNLQQLYSESKTKMLKDHSVQHAIDRRCGVIEV